MHLRSGVLTHIIVRLSSDNNDTPKGGLPEIFRAARQKLLNELLREKTYLLTYAPNEASNKTAHSREILHTWLSKMRPVKTLIRLRECAG